MQVTILGHAIVWRQDLDSKAIQQKYYFNIITNDLLNLICKSSEFQTSNYIWTLFRDFIVRIRKYDYMIAQIRVRILRNKSSGWSGSQGNVIPS